MNPILLILVALALIVDSSSLVAAYVVSPLAGVAFYLLTHGEI